MRKWVLLLAFVAMLWPSAAAAQAPDDVEEESVSIQINSNVVVSAEETIENLIVISGDATIEGTVSGTLLVIDGDVEVSGTVADDVTVISGDLNLLDGASVDNVHIIRGDVNRAPGATVSGDIEESDLSGLWAVAGVASVLFWIGLTIAAIVAGILFALIGGRQLTGAATGMTQDAVGSIVGAVFLVIALPIIAVIAMITVIGLPLGLGILLVLIPALAFLGYLVAATRLGMLVTGAMNRESGDRPILAVVLGVLILQVLLIIPFLGGLVVFLASLWGAGALVAYAFKGARGRRTVSESPPATA